MSTPSHTRYIVGIIALLSMLAMACGTFLLYTGYQSGELLVQIGSSGLSGLVGFLGGKMANDKPTVSNPTTVETVTVESKP